MGILSRFLDSVRCCVSRGICRGICRGGYQRQGDHDVKASLPMPKSRQNASRMLTGDADRVPSLKEQHAFLDAAKNSRFSQVEQLVLACPGLINCQPAGRWSALHQAAEKGDLRAVTFLLDHGASTAARTRDGLMPIDVAKPAVFDILFQASLSLSDDGESNGCATKEVLSNLALHKFGESNAPKSTEKGGDDDTDCVTCHICLDDYEFGDDLRTLPCGHFFHMCCVDEWLTEKSSCCPVCRSDCAIGSNPSF